ncbi:hypothetical protein VPH35_014615 [Triticum aestivum]
MRKSGSLNNSPREASSCITEWVRSKAILPKSEYFSKALYTFHFAQTISPWATCNIPNFNLDVGSLHYFTNKTTKQIEAYDPDPKERFTVAMQMEQHQERALLLQPHGSKQARHRPRGLISDHPHV